MHKDESYFRTVYTTTLTVPITHTILLTLPLEDDVQMSSEDVSESLDSESAQLYSKDSDSCFQLSSGTQTMQTSDFWEEFPTESEQPQTIPHDFDFSNSKIHNSNSDASSCGYESDSNVEMEDFWPDCDPQPSTSSRDIPEETDLEESFEIRRLSRNFQHFLAAVCDLRLPHEDYANLRLGLRHPQSPEVRRLLRRLQRRQISASDLLNTHPNAIVTVIKEVLTSEPPIFEHEEFVCLPVDCSNDLALCYLETLIDGLTSESRQLAFLSARAISGLVTVAGWTTHALTDAVMLFTPVFFPSCSSRAGSFLRASRVTLLLIENSGTLFSSYILVDKFYTELFGRLNRLHESIRSDSEDDESTTSQETGWSSDSEREIRIPEQCMKRAQSYYTLTYEYDETDS